MGTSYQITNYLHKESKIGIEKISNKFILLVSLQAGLFNQRFCFLIEYKEITNRKKEN